MRLISDATNATCMKNVYRGNLKLRLFIGNLLIFYLILIVQNFSAVIPWVSNTIFIKLRSPTWSLKTGSCWFFFYVCFTFHLPNLAKNRFWPPGDTTCKKWRHQLISDICSLLTFGSSVLSTCFFERLFYFSSSSVTADCRFLPCHPIAIWSDLKLCWVLEFFVALYLQDSVWTYSTEPTFDNLYFNTDIIYNTKSLKL